VAYTNLSLQKPLEDYVEYIEKLSLRSIPLLGEMSDPSFSFQDPYHDVTGAIEAQRLIEHRFKIYSGARYKVSDFTWGRRDATAYLFWSFRYRPKKKLLERSQSEALILEGMSEIMFSPDGKLYSHSEFWGRHDHFDVKEYRNNLK